MSHQNNCLYNLFIDELGVANPKDTQSQLYILAGCSVNEQERQKIKILADQIKFKYWGHTNIVFHSKEIGRKENDFRILKNKKVFSEFLADLGTFLYNSSFKMFFVLVDKRKAREKGWNDVKIYKETSVEMVRNFLLILLTSNSKGKITIESATAEKDIFIHKAAGHFLAEGIKGVGVDYKKIQEILTSISFVTKNNHDIEEQIADLFAYAAKCRFLSKKKIKFKVGIYEEMMLKLLEKKLFKPPQAKETKMKYFRRVKPFLALP